MADDLAVVEWLPLDETGVADEPPLTGGPHGGRHVGRHRAAACQWRVVLAGAAVAVLVAVGLVAARTDRAPVSRAAPATPSASPSTSAAVKTVDRCPPDVACTMNHTISNGVAAAFYTAFPGAQLGMRESASGRGPQEVRTTYYWEQLSATLTDGTTVQATVQHVPPGAPRMPRLYGAAGTGFAIVTTYRGSSQLMVVLLAPAGRAAPVAAAQDFTFDVPVND